MAHYVSGFYKRRYTLSDREYRVMGFLADDARESTGLVELSIREIAKGTGKSEGTVRRIIAGLEDKGELKGFSAIGRPSRKAPKAGEQYQRINMFFMVAYAQANGIPEPTGPEWDAAYKRRLMERERGRKTGTPKPPARNRTGGGARNRAGGSGTTHPRAESRDVYPRAGSRDGIKENKEKQKIDIPNGISAHDWPEPSIKNVQRPRSQDSIQPVDLSGKCDTKEKRGLRDAIFFPWVSHLEKRWGYKLDSSMWGRERQSAWHLARRGYQPDEVIKAYDQFKAEWGIKGHLSLNGIIRHMGAYRAGDKMGVQQNGRDLSAREVERRIGGDVSAETLRELAEMGLINPGTTSAAVSA